MCDASSGSAGNGVELARYSDGDLEGVGQAANKRRASKESGWIPPLHKDPNRHFERVYVFLAYRDLLTDVEMSMSEKTELEKATRRVVPRLASKYRSREHLLPYTDRGRVPKVLSALWKCGHFSRTSFLRNAYSDISEEQLLARDPNIQHRLPTLPVRPKDGEALNPVAIGKQERLDHSLHALSLKSGIALEELQKKFTIKDFNTRKQLVVVRAITDSVTAVTSQPSIRIRSDNREPILEELFENQPWRMRLRSDSKESVLEEQRSSKRRRINDVPIPPPRLQFPTPTDPPEQFELPFKIQHHLLAALQKLLEDALFDFSLKWLPHLLHQKNWHTSEQGELNTWWTALVRYGGTIPGIAVDFQDIDLGKLFRRAAQIRHIAVHRESVSNDKIISKFLPDAMLIVCGLRDTARSKQLTLFQNAMDGHNGVPNISALQELLGMSKDSHIIRRIMPLENDMPAVQATLEQAPDICNEESEKQSDGDNYSIYQKLLNSLDS